MEDYFQTLALDQSCKFALDASNGGTIYNSYHDETLRNFYAYNASWTDFQTAANTIGHDNFEFEITFKNNVAIPSSYVWLFYHNSQGGTTNIAYNFDLTSLFLGYNLYADDGSQIYCGSVLKSSILSSGVDIVSAGAVHTWKIGKSDTNVYVKINDITVFSAYHSSYATGNFKSNNTPASQFNGNILSAKLTNLTSNIIVWQATKTQLYNQDGIFPRTALRNFAVNNYKWNDFIIPQQNIGLDDVELELNIYWNYDVAPTASVAIFSYAGIETNAFYVYAYSNGSVALFSNLVGSQSILLRPIGSPLERGYHKITARVVGSQLIGYIDSETPKNYNGTRQTGLTFTAQISNFDGNILSAKLTNLTTNTIMWQAREDQLFLLYGVYPSALPRNFSTETSAWQDFNIVQKNADWTHDYTFEIDFENEAKEGSVFYSGVSSSMFGVYQYADSRLYAFIKLIGATANSYHFFVIRNGTNGFLLGRHNIKYVLVGNTCYCYLDGALIGTATLTRQEKPATLDRPVSNCGYVYHISLKDDTTNKQLFTYPNFEEEKRLITKSNVYDGNGYFEGANKTGTISNGNIWNIKTAYNIINQPLRSTYYCRANFASMTDTSTAMQWGFSTGNNLRAFYIQLASGVYTINFSLVAKTTVQESVQIPHAIAVTLLDKFVDYVITVDDVARVISIYADGVFIASKTFASNNLGFYQNADYTIYIGSTVTGACRADLSKIEKFAYFNRVFSDGEIKAISA